MSYEEIERKEKGTLEDFPTDGEHPDNTPLRTIVERATMFLSYINHMLTEKIVRIIFLVFSKANFQKASGFPKGCNTDEEKQKYVDEIEKREEIKVNVEDIVSDPGRRQTAKLALNSLVRFRSE